MIDMHRFVISAALVLLGSVALAQVPAPSPSAVAGLDAAAALDLANAWKGTDVTSFVTPEAIHFRFASGEEVLVALPEDRMVISVAPYLVQTHPCTTHYMSGCQGELVGAPVHVRALLADGTVLIDEMRPTMANGFIDLWLPRDQSVALELTLEDSSVIGIVTTFPNSPTCITTMRLTRAGG